MPHYEGNDMGNYECGKLYDLALRDLTPNPDQPRKVFPDAEIQVLADSIKEKGLLQPILVKELEDGQIIIVSGERRFKAHEKLKLETIPAWFTTGDPEELALVENLVREDLSAMETAEALKKFADRFNIKTHEDLGKRIGKGKSTVSEILSLNDLSENIRNTIRGDKRFALRELKKIATYKTPKAQEKLFAAYKAKIEVESLEKPTRVRSKGADLHIKKIKPIQDYFKKMVADDKVLELSSLREELINLKDDIETILNNLSQLTSKFDASNLQDVPAKPKKKKK
jgi:ParB family chromosome partitioning protein